jgi:Transmembrane secretion effector
VAIETVPYLAFGLFAGAFADRTDRRRLMWRCELISAVLLASIPVADAAGVLSVAQVYLVAVSAGVVFVWFDAANFGALPALVGRDRIASAYSWLNASASVLMIAAPAVGGLLAATIGPAPSLAVDAASCLISAALLLSIRRPFSAAAPDGPVGRLRDRIAEGFGFLWRHRTLRSLTITGFGNSAAIGAILGLLVAYANRQLGLPPTSALIGVLYASGAVGALLASLAMSRLMHRYSVLTIRLAGLTVQLLLILPFAVATSPLPAMLCYAGLGAGNEAVALSGIIYRQQGTPDHLQGRVNVAGRMLAWGGQPAGAAAAGAVAAATSIRAGLLAGAAGLVLAIILSLAGPLHVTAAQARATALPPPLPRPAAGD